MAQTHATLHINQPLSDGVNMKKISLTKMIILGLILGMIAGVVINNMASADTAKSYSQDISIFTTIFLRMVKMIIAPLVISTLVVGIAKMGDA